MKKYFLLPVIAAFALSGNVAQAQDFDTDPVIKVENKKEDVKFTIGARMMADAAYYHSEFTPMKSGAALVDARIRTSMSYDNWYFYADFDFSRGKFHQKNIFLQYTLESDKGFHGFKAGYYNNPIGMAKNTSIGSMHFITRSAAVNALGTGRELGISYKFYNDKFFANQGVFAENKYNDQISGFQGVSVGGRWLYRPINDEQKTLHVGMGLHYANISTGEVVNGNVLKTSYSIGTNMETYVDNTEMFMSATMPWAKHIVDLNIEALYKTPNFFVRGEYLYKAVTKERDDWALFEAGLGSIDSWGSLASWRGGNPLGTNSFMGGYIEAGYKFFGNDYRYSNADGVLKGLNGKSLEIVARYSYTGLNDLVAGEYYSLARDQYYPGGILKDYPATSKSIGGGNLHSATIGLNYAFNKFAQIMVNYTYNHLDRDKYVYDKNFHALQARLIFQF